MMAAMGRHADGRVRASSAGGRISLEKSGTFVSDKELKYRRWLALSEVMAEKHAMTRIQEERGRNSSSPVVQDRHYIRHNKTSLLRRSQLPVPPAEINYNETAKLKRDFEKRKRSLTTSLVMTSNIPDDEQSPHQFLIGSRYNSAHNIDSRSLMRLGVYVSRANISRVFVNSAGTIPPSSAIYGKVEKFSGNQSRPLTGYQFDIPPLTNSFPLIADDISAVPGSDISDCDSVVVQVEDMSTQAASQSSRPHSAYKDETPLSRSQLDSPKQPLSDSEDADIVTHTDVKKEVVDDELALIMSPEAQQLTENILRSSLDNNPSDNDEATPADYITTATKAHSAESLHVVESSTSEVACQTAISDAHSTLGDNSMPTPGNITSSVHTDEMQTETDSQSASQHVLKDSGGSDVHDATEDSAVHKTASTIFIDLAKLQDDNPSD